MSDLFLDLSTNPTTRQLIKKSGLPIPTPEPLERADGPMEERPLDGRAVVACCPHNSTATGALAEMLARAGASTTVVGDPKALVPFKKPGEAFGRPAVHAGWDTTPEGRGTYALVFDATAATDLTALDDLYRFFHAWLPGLRRSGRVVVLGPVESSAKGAESHAAAMALDGFTRSIAKEIGRTGATANLVRVERGAESRLAPVLRFLLSPHSAFVTAQPITVTKDVREATRVPTTRLLDKKVALVTGAARGIGEATAELLSAEGAHVVCLDRPDDDLPLSQVARNVGGTVLLADMAAEGTPAQVAEFLREKFGGVDIVVHNAGITRDKTLARMGEAQWQQALDVNLRGVLRVTEALLPKGIRDEGRIVCLSSVAGIAGNLGQTNYAASKAGVVGLVRGWAGPAAKRGIAVNAVAPGFIETRLTRAIPLMIREGGRRLSALGQGGLPEDVAQAIGFLSSPGAHGITGQVLRVCGGALIGA